MTDPNERDPAQGGHSLVVEEATPKLKKPPLYQVVLRTSDGTFFANGVLVHNCDSASGAFDELTQMQPASVEWNDEMSTENVVEFLTSANPYFANA